MRLLITGVINIILQTRFPTTPWQLMKRCMIFPFLPILEIWRRRWIITYKLYCWKPKRKRNFSLDIFPKHTNLNDPAGQSARLCWPFLNFINRSQRSSYLNFAGQYEHQGWSQRLPIGTDDFGETENRNQGHPSKCFQHCFWAGVRGNLYISKLSNECVHTSTISVNHNELLSSIPMVVF